MNPKPEMAEHRRSVRSFVLRGGRLTAAQSRAMSELWPRFGIPDGEQRIDPASLFERAAPLVLEIGFGNGEATWRMARDEPQRNFIGIEVHPPGVGHLLLRLQEHGLDNVRVANTDAVTWLAQRLAPASVDEVRIYFPDPWPKKRHHKRRLVQPPFLAAVARVLTAGGLLHIATDWEPYAEFMLHALSADPHFNNESPGKGYSEKPAWRPETKYERRGARLGHVTRDLLFRRAERRDGLTGDPA